MPKSTFHVFPLGSYERAIRWLVENPCVTASRMSPRGWLRRPRRRSELQVHAVALVADLFGKEHDHVIFNINQVIRGRPIT